MAIDYAAIKARAEAVPPRRPEGRSAPEDRTSDAWKACMEARSWNQWDAFLSGVEYARQDIPDLLAVIDRVREIHEEAREDYDRPSFCIYDGRPWPCPTILALDGDA